MVKRNDSYDVTRRSEQIALTPSERKNQNSTRPRHSYFDQFNRPSLYSCKKANALESQFLQFSFEPLRWRFRFSIILVAVISLVWGIYTQAFGLPNTTAYLIGGIAVVLVGGITFGITFMNFFRSNYRIIGGAWSLFLIAIILGCFAISPPALSYVVMTGACLKIIIMIYSLIPVTLVVRVALTVVLSVAFELLMYLLFDFNKLIFVRLVVHVSGHFIGIYLHVTSQALLRSTFYRQCRSVHTKRQIRIERAAKLDSIRSLMPNRFAQELIDKVDSQLHVSAAKMGAGQNDLEEDEEREKERDIASVLGRPHGFHVFNEFTGCQTNNVSILYADIIGIWIQKQTAQETVTLLNDVYTCLDQLCDATRCEKISTLGDCYHCVAGCPDPVEDHAERCIEFGRAICDAVTKYQLKMRVGIHSGTVIYGIMGVHRFRFDVWSNDVSLARNLKSTGEDGRVRISEDTLARVEGVYEVEEAQSIQDIRKSKVLVEYFDLEVRRFRTKETQDAVDLRTFFIVKRKDERESAVIEDAVSDTKSEASSISRPSIYRLVEDLRLERHSPLSLSAIHRLTLNFMEKDREERYRGHRSALFSYLFPTLIFFLLLLFIAGATASLPSPRSLIPLIVLTLVCIVMVLLLLLPIVQNQWWPRNVASAFVLLLPVILVFTRSSPCSSLSSIGSALLILPCIAVSCLPSSISAWAKVSSALLILISACPMLFAPHDCPPCLATNVSSPCNVTRDLEAGWPAPNAQSALAWLFTFIMVAFLARELDIAQRLNYLCNETTRKEQRAVRRAKLQADWLLRNIIPHRIMDELQIQKSYFREVDWCGVVFADISNFSYFYDEQFHGGQAMLGVLNEVIADIERLMLRPDYHHTVEKIKTIGSCFMAASGLNGVDGSWKHVRTLLNFCLDVRTVVLEFNKSMFSFDFELKIGISVGPVSAGVFGKKRLLYDILGDTVNQAFCLCSAAPTPGIRVPRSVAERLSEYFVFESGEELSGRVASAVQTCLLIRRR